MIGPLRGELRLFRIVLRLPGIKKNFHFRQQKNLFLKSYITLKYFQLIDFPKFEPLTTAEMALCRKPWAKMSKFILLSLRLSGIEFSLVSD